MLLIVSIAVLAAINALLAGFLLGYSYRTTRSVIQKLQEAHKEQEAEEKDSQVITTTPQLIREKQHHTTPNQEEESQIVTVKSPRQLAADKDRQLKEDLDKLTGKPN